MFIYIAGGDTSQGRPTLYDKQTSPLSNNGRPKPRLTPSGSKDKNKDSESGKYLCLFLI